MDVKLVVGFNETEIKNLLLEQAKIAAGKDVAGMGATIELGCGSPSAGDTKPLILATVTFNGKAK